MIHGSEGELRQVFLAIIDQRAGCDGRHRDADAETGEKGEFVFIRISDTGPGIAAGEYQQDFRSFFHDEIGKRGHRLGLSIAYKIITNHNGTIDVFSEEGNGTAFTITIPIPLPVN